MSTFLKEVSNLGCQTVPIFTSNKAGGLTLKCQGYGHNKKVTMMMPCIAVVVVHLGITLHSSLKSHMLYNKTHYFLIHRKPSTFDYLHFFLMYAFFLPISRRWREDLVYCELLRSVSSCCRKLLVSWRGNICLK